VLNKNLVFGDEKPRSYKLMSRGMGAAFIIWILTHGMLHLFGSVTKDDTHTRAISEHAVIRYITPMQASILDWIGILAISVSVALLVYYQLERLRYRNRKKDAI